jgi:hypothetical protein
MERILTGWREWVSLPDLDIPWIKAKIDTGARTSALHVFSIESVKSRGKPKLRIGLHPVQGRTDVERFCTVEVADKRWVMDSGGHREKRYVIISTIQLGEEHWPIEMTLTKRDNMKFRMLLGRTAMHHRLTVNPDAPYLAGRVPPKPVARLYRKQKKNT